MLGQHHSASAFITYNNLLVLIRCNAVIAWLVWRMNQKLWTFAGHQKLPVPNYYTLNVPAPSSLNTSGIRKLQALGNSNNQLANHQPLLLNLRPSFAAPAPLQLAHPSFGVFLDVFHGKTVLPSRRDYSFLHELALQGSNIFESEKERQALTISMLSGYLQLPITPWPELFPDCGRQRPDAADVDKVCYKLFICCCDLLPTNPQL